jgi:hypothetical protein
VVLVAEHLVEAAVEPVALLELHLKPLEVQAV